MACSEYKTRIAAYNVGDYTGEGFEDGSEEGAAAYRDAINAVGAEVLATQEDVPYYGKTNGRPTKTTVYSMYKSYACCGTWKYNHKAFLSDREITDKRKVYYVGDMWFHHPWFLTAEIELGGRPVRFINVHFDWTDKYVRQEEIRQVIEFARAYEYCIILGDFNPDDCVDMKKLSDHITWREDLAPFIEAGYIPANGGAHGVFTTLPCAGTQPYPCDNIVVSPNIRIDAVGVHTAPWMNDHAILYADITVM